MTEVSELTPLFHSLPQLFYTSRRVRTSLRRVLSREWVIRRFHTEFRLPREYCEVLREIFSSRYRAGVHNFSVWVFKIRTLRKNMARRGVRYSSQRLRYIISDLHDLRFLTVIKVEVHEKNSGRRVVVKYFVTEGLPG